MKTYLLTFLASMTGFFCTFGLGLHALNLVPTLTKENMATNPAGYIFLFTILLGIHFLEKMFPPLITLLEQKRELQPFWKNSRSWEIVTAGSVALLLFIPSLLLIFGQGNFLGLSPQGYKFGYNLFLMFAGYAITSTMVCMIRQCRDDLQDGRPFLPSLFKK